MALRLHAIALAEAAHAPSLAEGRSTGAFPSIELDTSLIPFRDLCAIVSDQKAFMLEEVMPADIERHRVIVDSIFRRTAVLPAPVGTVFRTADVLTRWMELHYVSLTGALDFVEERAGARVHILRADGEAEDVEVGSDIAAAAAEAFRALRRRAVAAVPLRIEEITGLVLSAAFLIERDLWKEFVHTVDEQRDAHHLLRFDLTGPWAPYDFVRMQFGG
jgi:hypothetical protein